MGFFNLFLSHMGLCRLCTQMEEINGTLSEEFVVKLDVHQGPGVLYCSLWYITRPPYHHHVISFQLCQVLLFYCPGLTTIENMTHVQWNTLEVSEGKSSLNFFQPHLILAVNSFFTYRAWSSSWTSYWPSSDIVNWGQVVGATGCWGQQVVGGNRSLGATGRWGQQVVGGNRSLGATGRWGQQVVGGNRSLVHSIQLYWSQINKYQISMHNDGGHKIYRECFKVFLFRCKLPNYISIANKQLKPSV